MRYGKEEHMKIGQLITHNMQDLNVIHTGTREILKLLEN